MSAITSPHEFEVSGITLLVSTLAISTLVGGDCQPSLPMNLAPKPARSRLAGASARPAKAHARPARGSAAPAPLPLHIPVVLTPGEVQRLLERMSGPTALMAALLCGSGLRLLECVELRVKDLDLERAEIRVRRGKGARDRLVPLALGLIEPLRRHLTAVRHQHHTDLRAGAGWVQLPDALAQKFPNAGREWIWHWVFPATRGYVHPATGQHRRHPATTMIYTHVLNRGGLGVRSPLDHLPVASPQPPINLTSLSAYAPPRRALEPFSMAWTAIVARPSCAKGLYSCL